MAESRHAKKAELLYSRRQDQFKQKLSEIAIEITKENLKDLKYLCADDIPDGIREKIRSSKRLFEELERIQKLSWDNTAWLVSQLRIIRRIDLANDLENWTNTDKIKHLLKKARLAHKEEKFTEEYKIYGEILELSSDQTSTEEEVSVRHKVLKKRATCLLAQGKFEESLTDCKKALEHSPQDLKAKFLLAQSFEGLGQYSEAYKELKILKQANPKDPEVLMLLRKVSEKVNPQDKLCEELPPCPSQANDYNIGEDYPTKVLFVCDKWSGWHLDIYSVNRHLCRNFAKTLGVKVACLVLDASKKDIDLASREGINLKKCSTRSGILDGDNRLYAMHTDFPFEPDIVFGHGLVTGAEASGLAQKFNSKIFQIFYDAPEVNIREEELQLGKNADFVAAVGPQLVNEWSNKLDCDVIEIIPGIPCDSSSRNANPTSDNRELIVDGATSIEAPGLDVSIKALRDCKQRGHQPMEIKVQGTPRLKKEELKKKLETKLGTSLFKIHVRSHDEIAMKVDGEMRAASLLLMPILSRTFGMRSLECISSGVPVILSNSYGIADVLIEHFDPKFWDFLCSASKEDDYESWSDRIDAFLDDREKKFALSSQLKQQWEKRFTWEAATKKILSHLSKSGKFLKSPKSCRVTGPSLPPSDDARNFIRDEVGLHERRRRHILIVSPGEGTKSTAIRHLAKFPWIAVLDFDKDSSETGYLSSCQALGDELGTKICPIRCPHSQKVNEKVTLPNGTPWLLIEDKPECLKWLRNVMSTLESSHLEPITLLILWNSSQENNKLTRKLDKLLIIIEASSLQDRVKVAVALIDGEKQFFVNGIEEDWHTKVYEIPLTDVCNALNESVCQSPSKYKGEKFSLPVAEEIGSEIVVTKILPPESRGINAELEVLYQSVGDNPDYESKDAQHFYRGGTISWYALRKGYAIKRTNWDPIKAEIDALLHTGGTRRRKLLHTPGSGGTTSSRWILFEFHKNYPCVNVRSIDQQETASAIKVLADFCKLPVVVLIDCIHVQREEFDLDILYNSLSNQRVSCVILEVTHRQDTHRTPRKKLTAPETLDYSERDAFIERYGQQKPESRQRLRGLKAEPEDLQIPFYYALVTYEDKFTALEPFVEDCLKNSATNQRQALIFLAMSHHYAHMSVSESALTSIFKAPRNTALNDLLTEESLQLLLEEGDGWRPRHGLIGSCMVKHILSDGINKANWILNLAGEAIKFISYMPEKLVSELLKHRANYSDFSLLIDEIPDDDDIIKVFERAIECFPNNPYFNVHLGRVYSIKKERAGFEMAIKYTNEGIKTADRDNFPKEVRGQFAQMKGVVYSRRVTFLIKEEAKIDDIIPFAEKGVEWFRRSVSISPVIDGYIPLVSMMCELFEHIHKTTEDLYRYYKCHPFILDGISEASDTLECVPDSESYSNYKARLLCLGLSKNAKEDLSKTIKLLEEVKLDNQISRGPINRKIVDMKIELCRQNGQDLSTVAPEVNTYLNEAMKFAQNKRDKELTMRRWVQIAPFLQVHLSEAELEKLIFKWCQDCKSVHSYLYKYIISFIHVLDGRKHYVERMKNSHDDLQHELTKVINRGDVGQVRHPNKPVVWLGLESAKGMGKLVYLENIVKDKTNKRKKILGPEHTKKLRTLTGTIIDIERQEGIISIKDDLEVNFRTDLCDQPLSSKTFCHWKVQFNLGFNCRRPEAYNVQLISNN